MDCDAHPEGQAHVCEMMDMKGLPYISIGRLNLPDLCFLDSHMHVDPRGAGQNVDSDSVGLGGTRDSPFITSSKEMPTWPV